MLLASQLTGYRDGKAHIFVFLRSSAHLLYMHMDQVIDNSHMVVILSRTEY